MTEPDEPVGPPMMCDACGTRLNNHEQWENGRIVKLWWEHTGLIPDEYLTPEGLVDHEPVPVLLEPNENPRVGFCDFCNAQDPVWSFPVAPFKMEITDKTGWGSADNWASCPDCKEDIEAHRWDQIHQRYFNHKRAPKHLRNALRQQLEILHRNFRLHRLGPPFRVR